MNTSTDVAVVTNINTFGSLTSREPDVYSFISEAADKPCLEEILSLIDCRFSLSELTRMQHSWIKRIGNYKPDFLSGKSKFPLDDHSLNDDTELSRHACRHGTSSASFPIWSAPKRVLPCHPGSQGSVALNPPFHATWRKITGRFVFCGTFLAWNMVQALQLFNWTFRSMVSGLSSLRRERPSVANCKLII